MSQSMQIDLRIASPAAPLPRIRTMESTSSNSKTAPAVEENVVFDCFFPSFTVNSFKVCIIKYFMFLGENY